MKRRRGRRGFWWWSWILVLLAIGGTVGGWFWGQQNWEKAPKEFPSTAIVTVDVRKPFKASGVDAPETGLENINEAQVIQFVQSFEGLEPVIEALDLSQKWALGADEVVTSLQNSLDLDLDREKKELYVTVVRDNPEEAAELANAIAKRVAPTIKTLDEVLRSEGQKRLELELAPYFKRTEEFQAALKAALEANKIPIDPKPGVDISAYLEIPAVLAAKVDWDDSLESVRVAKQEQREFTNYWRRELKSSFVSTKALPAPTFTGPEKKPFQVEGALYGMTAGLVLSLLLMLICWKLFP